MQQPARILVVCTANVARSPLGAAVLRTHADHALGALANDVQVASAGVHARDGDPAADGTIAVADTWGIDLSGHRSRPLDPEMVVAADLVLTMSTRQRRLVLDEVVEASPKVFTWPELVRLLRGASIPRCPTVQERVRAAAEVAHHRRPFSTPPRRREDVDDPFGGPYAGFVLLANELADGGDLLGPALFDVAVRDRADLAASA